MDRPFPPGVSGNPGGRPTGLAAYVRERTRDGREIVESTVAVIIDGEPEVSRGVFRNAVVSGARRQ